MAFTNLNLRPVDAGDDPFVRAVFFATQRGIIEALFGWRGEELEFATFRASYDAANTSIIVVDGDDAGWLTVKRGGDIELDAIYLTPSMQRRGVGTALIHDLISEARSTAKTLRLSTAKINPARRLYERLGFAECGESEFKVFLEWRPASPNLRFARPSAALAASFAAMRDAFMAAGEDYWTTQDQELAHHDPLAYAEALRGWSEGRNLPPHRTPFDAFWIVRDDVVVGQCGIRHPLTPTLEAFGGNVGYEVHPAYRKQGIATFALGEALGLLATKGVTDALITYAHDNAASIRVIERCGGRRIADTTRRRYLIATHRDG
jgi:predicted acetyltransferase